MNILGIDLGTSGIKVGLFDAETFHLLATASAEYPLYQPRPNYAEQAPQDWWRAIVAAVRETCRDVDPGRIAAIGIDGQMHGVVCLDQAYQPLQPAVIWADARSTRQVEELAAFQNDSHAALPGIPATGFMASSLRWMRHHRPEVLRQTRLALLPKDLIRLWLTGQVASEPSDAASTWLFDLHSGDWALDLVDFCGLSPGQLAPIRASDAFVGGLTPRAARQLGLPEGIPVVAGSADLPAQALGHGLSRPGEVLVTIGSGGQVLLLQDELPAYPPDCLYRFPYSLSDRWYTMAAMLSAGLSLRWLRDLLGIGPAGAAYAGLSALAGQAPAGAGGVLFLPYLAGERSPHRDPRASGLFLGLRLQHGPAHLARAVMEGVGFGLLECLNLIAGPGEAVILSGGAARSALWCQILADIWARPVEIAEPELPRACLGSALLAGIALGQSADSIETVRSQAVVTRFHPAQSERYADLFVQYRRLYPKLRTIMHRLDDAAGPGG